MAITVVRRVNRLLSAGLFAIVLGGCAAHAPIQPNARLADVLKQQQSADAAYKAGDMQTAADLYARLVHEVPSEADYWYRLGNVQFRQQQPDEAVISYGRAIELFPRHARAWHNLGIVRLRQAQAAMQASALSAKDDDPLHATSVRMAARIARIGDDKSVGASTESAPIHSSNSAVEATPSQGVH